MKRLFPASLALLLVLSSLGHVFAAAFCPRMPGHDCCLTKTASSQNSSQPHQHVRGMAMDGMANESMTMDGSDMPDVMMDETAPSTSSTGIGEVTLPSNSDELVNTSKLQAPIEPCTHCMGHSGMQNAPVSSVSVPDQSNKYLASIPLPVSRFLVQPAMTLAQIGLPKDHAPPGGSAPRHILINVFQI